MFANFKLAVMLTISLAMVGPATAQNATCVNDFPGCSELCTKALGILCDLLSTNCQPDCVSVIGDSCEAACIVSPSASPSSSVFPTSSVVSSLKARFTGFPDLS